MQKRPLLYIIVSAALFGISPPVAKVLLDDLDPVVLAGLLYLGAFIGLSLLSAVRGISGNAPEPAPWEGMTSPGCSERSPPDGVVAPIALMFGLTSVSGFTASLLLNLEGVATALIAVLIFREYAGRRLWAALLLMTVAGILLSLGPGSGSQDLIGPLLIVLAMVCWGLDNNLTRHISGKDAVRIAQIKGLVAGLTSLSVAVALGFRLTIETSILFALLLGALSYGISLVLAIKAMEGMGSSRAGAVFQLRPVRRGGRVHNLPGRSGKCPLRDRSRPHGPRSRRAGCREACSCSSSSPGGPHSCPYRRRASPP